MAKVAVLGAGLAGRVIAQDLASGHTVTVADAPGATLAGLVDCGAGTRALDLRDDSAVAGFVTGYDIVVCAVPSELGYRVLNVLVEAGCRLADVSFAPENIMRLHQRARETGAVVLTDMGLAPGTANLALGHHAKSLRIHSFARYAGINPLRPRPPARFRTAADINEVIAEYINPVRLKRDGELLEMPACSERETVNIEGAGELEAFLVDGLRTLPESMPHLHDIQAKGLRWPGHLEIVEAMREAGLFDNRAVEIDGGEIMPRRLATSLLGSAWRLGQDEDDLALIRARITGEQDGRVRSHTWDFRDVRDPQEGFTACARIHGLPCAAATSLLADGYWHETGVFAPEQVGTHDIAFKYILKYLEERGVRCRHDEQPVETN